VNSELAKRQGMAQGRVQRLEQLLEQAKPLQVQVHAYQEQGMELSLQVTLFETTGQTEERGYFPLKARQLAVDWEMRQRKARLS
jgi:hypothetical protein